MSQWYLLFIGKAGVICSIFCIHHPIPLEHSHISYQFNLSTNPHIYFHVFLFWLCKFYFHVNDNKLCCFECFLEEKKIKGFFRYCWSICKLGLFSLRTFSRQMFQLGRCLADTNKAICLITHDAYMLEMNS